MPTPPFALPLHLEPGRVGNSATVVDDNGDNVCYGYLPAMQAIVAAVNRVAVLEQALGDLIDMVNDGAPLPASPAYLRDGDTIRIESGYADKFRAACALLAAALKD